MISHISKDRLSKDLNVSHDLQFLDSEDTSIEVMRGSFRWVLDNDEGRSSKEAYKDAWLFGIGNEDSESDEMFLYDDNFVGGES